MMASFMSIQVRYNNAGPGGGGSAWRNVAGNGSDISENPHL